MSKLLWILKWSTSETRLFGSDDQSKYQVELGRTDDSDHEHVEGLSDFGMDTVGDLTMSNIFLLIHSSIFNSKFTKDFKFFVLV